MESIEWSNPVAWWWLFLVVVSVLNPPLWWAVTRAVARGLGPASPEELRRFRQVAALSAVYMVGCAFRSFLPRADVQRICLFDTWWSNVFVGRTVATIAELSFAVQGAVVLWFISTSLRSAAGRVIAVVLVVQIVLAECFSWYAVITTNFLGNTLEQSLWTWSYTLVGFALLALSFRAQGALKLLGRVTGLGSSLYVGFMLSTDVPMYLGRYRLDEASGRTYLGFQEGIHDLLTRWVVTWDLVEWRPELAWMVLYFSISVWLSILLCAAPLTARQMAAWQRPPGAREPLRALERA